MASNPNASPSMLYRFTHLQPSVYRGIVTAIFGVLASLGIVVSDDIPDQIIVLVLAILPLVQALWTKGAVTPNDKVVAYVEDPYEGRHSIEPGPAVPAASLSQTRVLGAVYNKAA
jgi:hypothetical protein